MDENETLSQETDETSNENDLGEETQDTDLEEKLRLKDEEIEKWKKRAKQSYKKSQELIKNVPSDISEEKLEQRYQKKKSEETFTQKYPDAQEKMSEIKKISAEKWLSMEDAYKIVAFDTKQSTWWVYNSFAKLPAEDKNVESVLAWKWMEKKSIWGK